VKDLGVFATNDLLFEEHMKKSWFSRAFGGNF